MSPEFFNYFFCLCCYYCCFIDTFNNAVDVINAHTHLATAVEAHVAIVYDVSNPLPMLLLISMFLLFCYCFFASYDAVSLILSLMLLVLSILLLI